MGKNALAAAYNWPAAFVSFSNGATLDEISLTMAIPMALLERRYRDDNWHALSARIKREAPQLHSDTAAQMEVMRLNRMENLVIAKKLREDLVDVVERLRETKGTAMIEKHWHNRGAIVTREVPLGMQDRVALATYAKLVFDLTYRALGDKDAAEGGAHSPGDAQGAAPSITIILPGVIAHPRKDMQARDLRSNTTLDLSGEQVTVTEERPADGSQVPQ